MVIILSVVTFGNSSTIKYDENDNDDALSTSAAVGITFVVTLIVSVLFTLVIVYIVYRIIKKKAGADENEARVVFSSASMGAKNSTIKVTESSCDSETYVFPEDLERATSTNRYQGNPVAPMQRNPAYGLSKFNKITDPVYENVK